METRSIFCSLGENLHDLANDPSFYTLDPEVAGKIICGNILSISTAKQIIANFYKYHGLKALVLLGSIECGQIGALAWDVISPLLKAPLLREIFESRKKETLVKQKIEELYMLTAEEQTQMPKLNSSIFQKGIEKKSDAEIFEGEKLQSSQDAVPKRISSIEQISENAEFGSPEWYQRQNYIKSHINTLEGMLSSVSLSPSKNKIPKFSKKSKVEKIWS